MSERSGAQLRLKIAAERDGLAGDLAELRRELRPLVAIVAAAWIAVLFLVFWRRRSARASRSGRATGSNRPNDVPRLTVAIFLVKLLWKLRKIRPHVRPDPETLDTRVTVVVVPEDSVIARRAPWPQARQTSDQGEAAAAAEVSGG